MNYLSTRGDSTPRKFCEILLEGLAPDGGLYLPANYPHINDIALGKLRDIYDKHGYADLAFAILSLYIDDIHAADHAMLGQQGRRSETLLLPHVGYHNRLA